MQFRNIYNINHFIKTANILVPEDVIDIQFDDEEKAVEVYIKYRNRLKDLEKDLESYGGDKNNLIRANKELGKLHDSIAFGLRAKDEGNKFKGELENARRYFSTLVYEHIYHLTWRDEDKTTEKLRDSGFLDDILQIQQELEKIGQEKYDLYDIQGYLSVYTNPDGSITIQIFDIVYNGSYDEDAELAQEPEDSLDTYTPFKNLNDMIRVPKAPEAPSEYEQELEDNAVEEEAVEEDIQFKDIVISFLKETKIYNTIKTIIRREPEIEVRENASIHEPHEYLYFIIPYEGADSVMRELHNISKR